MTFDYAAVHYVVRPTADFEFEGVEIAAGMPCEVQIKTLLQHAYSELTHDTIYKPQIEATAIMQRNAAKAMALLEATNDYFEKVSEDVSTALASVREMTAKLSEIYRDTVGIDPRPTALEGLLLEAYEGVLGEDYLQSVREVMNENSFIAQQIKLHLKEGNPIFSQPSVLLVYAAVKRSLKKAIRIWPLSPSEMETLLNDLGESMN